MRYKLFVVTKGFNAIHTTVIDFDSRREADIAATNILNYCCDSKVTKLYEESNHERAAASRRDNREAGRQSENL